MDLDDKKTLLPLSAMDATEGLAAGIYCIATPIGNLTDITFRALQTLATVDVIYAEDTRVTSKLLRHYCIDNKSLHSYHLFNEQSKTNAILDQIEAGRSIALVSDAGTPVISDPGFLLIKQAVERNTLVVSVPGPCALIAALSVSGLSAHSFCFEGFLPAKRSQREQRLQQLSNEPRTLIFYESTHRIKASLKDMLTVFGSDRFVVIARELTKLHETFYRGKLGELVPTLQDRPEIEKGEIVVLVEADKAKAADSNSDQEVKHILSVLLKSMPVSQAVKSTSEITGIKKNRVYELAKKIEHHEK